MSYNGNAWGTQRKSKKSDETSPTYLIPGKSGGFNPTSEYIQKSIDEYLSDGGQITKIKTTNYAEFMSTKHDCRADQYLRGK